MEGGHSFVQPRPLQFFNCKSEPQTFTSFHSCAAGLGEEVVGKCVLMYAERLEAGAKPPTPTADSQDKGQWYHRPSHLPNPSLHK